MISTLLAHGLALVIIVCLESILSFDNIAVLAVIVNKNLPVEQRNKALRYGMWGAFIFRGAALFLVAYLLANPHIGDWIKVAGGAYLLRLGITGLTPKADSIEEGEVSWADKIWKVLKLTPFWRTVVIVEMVDFAFSIDNIVAVVSVSSNIWVVVIGVILGIVTMRYLAGLFTKLMQKTPALEKSAFIVIILLALKLILSGLVKLLNFEAISEVMNNHRFDLYYSLGMMIIFFWPLIFKKREVIA